MSKNLGEQNEIFLKAFLLMSFTDKLILTGPHNIGEIKSLKFSSNGALPIWKEAYRESLVNRDYDALKIIFPKAGTRSKADLEINGVRYSVKNSLGAKSAIINHTNRKGFLRVFQSLELDISTLDSAINEYWEKREAGDIKEDIKNSSTNSPFAKHKDYLKPIIEYFLFSGTGKYDSIFPADKMLIFAEPENTLTYEVLTKDEAVDKIWDELTFSVRSKKGMPKKFDLTKHVDIAPWVRIVNAGEPKGALHIRI